MFRQHSLEVRGRQELKRGRYRKIVQHSSSSSKKEEKGRTDGAITERMGKKYSEQEARAI